MWGGRKAGFLVLVLTIIFVAWTFRYTEQVNVQREELLATLPSVQECGDEPGLCPHTENFQVPDAMGVGMIIIALTLALYLFRSDSSQQQILRELRRADVKTSDQERLELVLSILKDDEKKVFLAIKEQEGITQHTLRLRTDFSKAKLSSILKELEARELVKKESEGKTNSLYLKRNL